MHALAEATAQMTETLAGMILDSLEGIPDEALGTWVPDAARNGGGEMNTFAAIAIHTVSAARWMLEHQVLGDAVDRDREAEFHATATQAEIRALYDSWLTDMRADLARLDGIDLSQMPPTIRPNHPDWNRAAWLLHMIEHTGLHAGHLQIQRQLWNADQSDNPIP